MVPEAGRAEEAQRAAGLKKVPLDGFMGEADWNGVCLEMRTRGGVFWPIPVTLSASDQQPVFRQLLLEAQQALLVPGLHQLADQSHRCDKANGAAFLAGRQTEAEGDMGLAGTAVAQRDAVLAALDVFTARQLQDQQLVER